MREFPKGGIIGKAVDAANTIKQMHIPLHAAYAGYFIVLSLFPALVLLLSVLRYTGLQVESLIDLVRDFLPGALMDGAEGLIYSTYRNSSGAVVGLSAVTALWSASRGIYGLLTGLNAVYGVSENRGYIYTRSISVVYTFVFFLILLLTLVLHVFGNSIISLLTMVDNPVLIFLIDLIDLRFFLLLILQSLIFTVMFMALPNKRNRFLASLPGGVLTSLGWLVFSDIYSIYVENFSNYSNIYGSVYAVAISMLWLYCCLSILFYGGALNRYLMGENKKNL
ncbi:MAG: YihY/virulence factor BrkB family protein [Faecousia sp.]